MSGDGAITGTVVRARLDRGFVYVTPDGATGEGTWYFAHVSSFADEAAFARLRAGDRVRFTPAAGARGPRAIDCDVVEVGRADVMTGTVIAAGDRAYGFILADDDQAVGRDGRRRGVFFNITALVDPSRGCVVGDRVRFVRVPAERGPRAEAVEHLDDPVTS